MAVVKALLVLVLVDIVVEVVAEEEDGAVVLAEDGDVDAEEVVDEEKQEVVVGETEEVVEVVVVDLALRSVPNRIRSSSLLATGEMRSSWSELIVVG